MLMEAMQFEKSPMDVEIVLSMKSHTIMMCREPEEIEISMVDFVTPSRSTYSLGLMFCVVAV